MTRILKIGSMLVAAVMSGCTTPSASKSPSAVAAETEEFCRHFLHLPAAQPQCDYVNYHHDEATNVEGAGRCMTDCECDGVRSCVNHICTGIARPTGMDQCHKPDYRWNEEWNGGGPGLCANDCECNATRSCVNGRCQDEPPQRDWNGRQKFPH